MTEEQLKLANLIRADIRDCDKALEDVEIFFTYTLPITLPKEVVEEAKKQLEGHIKAHIETLIKAFESL